MYKWIQKTGLKKDVFSNQLDIPPKNKIPMVLLNRIIAAKRGDIVKNPANIGKKSIKVTSLLKKRAILVRNLKRISEDRKRNRRKFLNK